MFRLITSIINFSLRATKLYGVSRILRYGYKSKKMPWLKKALPILAIIYLISPIDFIPDVIPVIMHIEDIIFLVGSYFFLKSGLSKEEIDEAIGNDGKPKKIVDVESKVIQKEKDDT